MHFLTVAGAKVSAKHDTLVSADLVQSTIRALVAELFTCSSCRKHFLTAFDDCSFNRCGTTNDSLGFPRLQLWLFRLHNAVTTRIYKEKGGTEESGSVADFRQVVWPGTDVNLGKSHDTIVDPQLVLRHVQEAYWEDEWGELVALPNRLDRLLER
jgi:hypothetical protein